MSPLPQRLPSSPEHIDVTSPYDGRVVGRVPLTGADAIFAAVRRAQVAQAEFAFSTPAQRRDLLDALATAIAGEAESLAQLICAEVGKTIAEARNEVRRAQNTLRLSGDAATFLDGEVLHCGIVAGGANRQAVITYEPTGVVGAITPFNYPLNLLCHKLGPAIAAGNAVVAKPSPKAPLAAQRLAELAMEAGFPQHLFQIVHGGAAEALTLARAPIDLLSFTGGPAAGLALKNAAGLFRCLMELGGNDPLFVMPDADLPAAINTAIAQRYEIAGQSCAAVKKLYLHADIHDAMLDALVEAAKAVRHGDPLDPATQMGPVIDTQSATQVRARIEAATASGARLLAGGTGQGSMLVPSVIADVPPDSDLFAQETFGPVISVRRFTDVGAAIAEVNAGAHGLQAGVFSNDHAVLKRFSRELRVGGVMINEGPDFRAEHVPFGGIKGSGLGREGVRIALREMSETKVVID
ncbi:aldehyde dehydrogenase family protein [Devosia ginsengisoli]|uniref:aldehyde dehydrogenase family protein n=1 Tax=Devosia ginsengisoli TaxID=400770 RepID=UPI0026EFDF61|nr:aldehyde dehydrogenase family protein [Devosia ginsengisoli]MCR6673134.1 aldehyde dehydrogenase family protein [Devosia ginsengisoli]